MFGKWEEEAGVWVGEGPREEGRGLSDRVRDKGVKEERTFRVLGARD